MNKLMDSRKIKILLIGISILVLFSGCAPKVPVSTQKEDHTSKSFEKDSKYANIYLCRNSFMGGAYNLSVLLDDNFVGRTDMNSYFHLKVKPGKHKVDSVGSNKDTLILNAKSNNNYFIIQEPILTLTTTGVRMKLVNEDEGKKCVLATKKLKLQSGSSINMKTMKKRVKPTYVSPDKYKNYSCDELNKIVNVKHQKAIVLSKKLEDYVQQQNATGAIALTLYLPASSYGFHPNSEKEIEELMKILGEYNAIKEIATHKKCSFASSLEWKIQKHEE